MAMDGQVPHAKHTSALRESISLSSGRQRPFKASIAPAVTSEGWVGWLDGEYWARFWAPTFAGVKSLLQERVDNEAQRQRFEAQAAAERIRQRDEQWRQDCEQDVADSPYILAPGGST